MRSRYQRKLAFGIRSSESKSMPWRVVARPDDYLLAPHETYERVGDVPNVVFPTAALVDNEHDRVTVYCGAADTVVCLAHGHLPEILSFVLASRGGIASSRRD